MSEARSAAFQSIKQDNNLKKTIHFINENIIGQILINLILYVTLQ